MKCVLMVESRGTTITWIDICNDNIRYNARGTLTLEIEIERVTSACGDEAVQPSLRALAVCNLLKAPACFKC